MSFYKFWKILHPKLWHRLTVTHYPTAIQRLMHCWCLLDSVHFSDGAVTGRCGVKDKVKRTFRPSARSGDPVKGPQNFYILFMNKYTVLCIPRPVKRVEAQEHYEDTDYLRNHKGITFRFIMMMMLVLPSGHLSGLGKSQGCKVLLVLMIVKHLPLHQCVQCEPLPPRVGCGNT